MLDLGSGTIDPMTGTPPPLPEPGWYQDPDQDDRLRWWNGEEWSEHRRPRDQDRPGSVPLGRPVSGEISDFQQKSQMPLTMPTAPVAQGMPAYPNSIPVSVRPSYPNSTSMGLAPEKLRGLAIWILVFGIGYILVALAGIGLSIAALSKIGKSGIDGDIGLTYTALKQGSDPLSALYSLSGLFIMLPLGIISLVWFHRAYRNLARRGFQLRFGTGWAIGSWFIPVFNWIRPKSIANDLYRADLGELPDAAQLTAGTMDEADEIAGRPQRIGVRYPWTQVKVAPLLHYWWLLYIIGGAVSGIGYGLALGSFSVADNYMKGVVIEKPDAHTLLQVSQVGYIILMVGYAMMITSAILYLMVVQKISEKQDRLLPTALR